MNMQISQIFYATHGFRPHADRPRAVAGRVWDALRRALRAWRKREMLRRAVLELNQLDDRMLRDIGIERSCIGYAVRHGRCEREHRLGLDRAETWR